MTDNIRSGHIWLMDDGRPRQGFTITIHVETSVDEVVALYEALVSAYSTGTQTPRDLLLQGALMDGIPNFKQEWNGDSVTLTGSFLSFASQESDGESTGPRAREAGTE